MILSLDESIQKLKTEILSQDWSLSQKKIEPLQAAFTCLKNRFKTRKNALTILTMADSVLLYAQKRQGDVPPEFIDFLKETMAHVVNMYEDTKFDPDRDAELFKRVYSKFAKLKEKVAAEKGAPSEPVARDAGSSPGLEPWEEPTSLDDAPSSPAQTVASPRPSVNRTPGKVSGKTSEAKSLPIEPGTMLRPITIGKLSLAITEEHIALIKPLSPKKRKAYIKNSQVPLKDLGGWFSSLSAQMRGPLSQLKNGKLKKFILPLVIPKGVGFTDFPDEEATMLVLVSSGQWHGVLFCRRLGPEAAPMLSLTRTKNGDIAGSVRLEEDQELQLLNVGQLLEREGFLCMPE